MRTDKGKAASGALIETAPGAAPAPYSQVLHLKRCGPEPLYYQLAQSVEKAVESGTISHGTRLLPEKDMARELNVAVATVRNAWAYLDGKGVLTRHRPAGTIVQ
ncbi:GntR family transcriptional regulator [Arthrobacter sp. KNU-44]|uniref:GntR family transcriptional regulator n=1 Tax=Arthrobacter sp. KNU-44 TaxID=3450744 RepID=UPI003F4273C0